MPEKLENIPPWPLAHPPGESPRQIVLMGPSCPEATERAEVIEEHLPEAEVLCCQQVTEALSAIADGAGCVVIDADRDDGILAGLARIRQIREAFPHVPIVTLVSNDADGEPTLQAGSHDYLLKERAGGAEMSRAIRHAVQRERAESYFRELAVLRFQSAESARVQRGLIPRPMIEDPRITTRSGYRPGDRRQVLGGDFFDVIQTAPTRLHVVLGDVCGHGPDEAALGVQLRIAWRTLVLAGIDNAQLLVTLDRLAETERHAEHIYVTLASLEIDLAAQVGHVSLAGHPPPILASDGQVRLISEQPGGPPLGLRLPPRWAVDTVELGERWTTLLYSDGIYEGHVVSRGTRLGIDGLLAMLAEGGPDGVWRSVPDRLLDAVEGLNEGPLEDDVALLAVRYDG